MNTYSTNQAAYDSIEEPKDKEYDSIEEPKDKEYLTELLRFVQMDLDNLTDEKINSRVSVQSRLRNISPDEIKKSLISTKKQIENKRDLIISQLSKLN